MFREVLLVLGAVALASTGKSPHADFISTLQQTPYGARYSNDVYEDASLDVPELVRKYVYPLEVHSVTTEDGYILEMHRIPHGRDKNNKPDSNKPIIFLMHGLLSSSADWIVMGPGTAFGYLLAEEGFDVWMGNARGNYYSRKHVSLNPDALIGTTFWDFTWDEIGNYDLTAMIDYALAHTGKQGLHYVGHSQGTTAFFVMGSLRPEYNEKILSMHALAPVAFMAHNENLFLRFIANYAHELWTIASVIGIGEFMPRSEVISRFGQALYEDEEVTESPFFTMIDIIGGHNSNQRNETMEPVTSGHAPAGASVKQFGHYGQSIANKGFRRYDFGSVVNLLKYGRINPPSYDLNQVTAPVFLYYSEADTLAHVEDVYNLHRQLGQPVGLFRVNYKEFSHVDFIWGIDAKTLLYDRVITLAKAFD